MSLRTISFTVTEETAGLRIDKGVSELYEDLSRSGISKVIKEGRATVNDRVVKPSYILAEGDRVSLSVPENQIPDIEPEDIPIDVLYEDDDLIIVDKPKGMVVHPAAGHYSGTLVNALMYRCGTLSGINGVMRPGIVHRIDRDTTGSLIVCKNDGAHRAIAEQLASHSIDRRYRAIVCGVLPEDGTVDAPIGRDPKDRKRMAVRPGGRRAVTHYKVLEHFGEYTYVECRLETGRTHQIRVHMAHIGHPVMGDEVYGRRKCPYDTEGQVLHAYYLAFERPGGKGRLEIVSPMPDYFEDILKKLRRV